MINYFDLLDTGNAITPADITKGILRITVHAKAFFTNFNEVAMIFQYSVTPNEIYQQVRAI